MKFSTGHNAMASCIAVRDLIRDAIKAPTASGKAANLDMAEAELRIIASALGLVVIDPASPDAPAQLAALAARMGVRVVEAPE